jgi:hypothetical protein
MTKISKTQLFQQFKYDVCYDESYGDIIYRLILTDCDDIRELKSELKHLADKYYCLAEQEHRAIKYYLGTPCRISHKSVLEMIDVIKDIADKCGYELYSVNKGFSYFIKSK